MYISIDLGRSTTRIASTLDLKNIFKIVKFPTDNNINAQKKNMSEAVISVSNLDKIDAVAFGFPGISSKIKNKIEKSANYPQIEGMDFSSFLPEKARDAKIIVENDAALGALGEAYFGSGKNNKIVAYLTLSTGVGGARVVKGKNENDYELINSEPGHQVIEKTDDIEDGSGIKGTLESFCSGSYFKQRYGVNPDKTAGEDVWKKYAFYLSAGILNVIAMWDPEVIILGGGLAIYNFDSFYPFLMKELEKQNFFEIPKIKKTLMEDDSGIYGGFILLERNL